MIPIDRGGGEPARLAAARAERIPLVASRVASGEPYDDLQTDYDVRPELRAAQYCKCAYCELHCQQGHYPVDHYRPKHRYWWLTWTWENLLFTCATCNEHKGDRFPLCAGPRLTAYDDPPGTEESAIVDPSSDDPSRHIHFRYLDGHWRPTPRGGSLIGDATIRIIKLDRPGLLDLYDMYVSAHLQPKVDEVHAAIDSGDSGRLARAWHSACGTLSPSTDFTALAYDVIDAYIPQEIRDEYGLALAAPT